MTYTIIIPLIVMAAIVLIIALASQTRSRQKCPVCASSRLQELSRETLRSRTVEYMGSGTPAGGDIRVQLDLEVSYRCQQCGETFQRKITATQ